jgi:glucose 1-dehydrogenase
MVAGVTGGAQGIGRSIATLLAMNGAAVAVIDVDAGHASTAAAEIEDIGVRACAITRDLSEPGAGSAIVSETVEALGRLDILVNNARGGHKGVQGAETEENWDVTLSVCLKAPFFAAQAALSVMERGGSIINVVSVAGRHVSCETASYHAAKAALEHVTRYLAVRAGVAGLRVNAVAPGFIVKDEHLERYTRADNTDYRALVESCHPLGFPGQSNDVAAAVLYLCSPAARFITGHTLVVDGGLSLQEAWAVLSGNQDATRQNV